MGSRLAPVPAAACRSAVAILSTHQSRGNRVHHRVAGRFIRRIYGANAANGVVLIQTKACHRGAPQFEYTGSVSSSVIDRRPDMLNAAQFRTAVQTYAR